MADYVEPSSTTRRDFLKCSALLGVSPMLLRALDTQAADASPGMAYGLNDAENMIFSVCLGCNTGCGIKVKIQDGVAVKIDGNPLTPWNASPHLPYATKVRDAARTEGALCPKGQAGIMTVYDPYRIKRVLKRDGPRGSMRWKAIDFQQAVDEIVNGGKLFSHVEGEETRNVEGLQDLWVLRDPKLAGEMGKAVDGIWSEKDAEKKKAKVEEFKAKFKDNLNVLIDPEHPDLGPKNNQFVWTHGRLKGGRGEFFSRFVKDSFGSANYHGHTTVCQGSLYFTGKAMSEQYAFDEKKKRADWTGGDKFFWQADQSASEFILFVGSSPFEANYPPLRTTNIVNGLSEGRLKYAVVDPRYSKVASKAWKWLPAKPGHEAAIAFGMMRWILENERYDEKYLKNANKAAATVDGEPTWNNGCWLVKVKDGKPGEFLRASEIGEAKEKRTATVGADTVEYEFDRFVVLSGGKATSFDPNDEKAVVEGDFFVDTQVNGIAVKTVLQLLREEASKKSIADWGKACDVSEQDLVELAREFTSHGKKAAACTHRGCSQHTNGFYNCFSFNTLNLLIGNYDWRGGMVKASTYDTTGGKATGPFDFKAGMHPKKAKPFGVGILREKKYEEVTLFDGTYPSKRPWFPNATDLYQEILPSIGDAYPYPVKALLLYMGSPAYSLPAGQKAIEVLADTDKLPLFVASDIVIGESSMFADYIIPDLTYLERWEFHGSHPNNIWKVQPVRQPAVAPIPETVKVFGEEMPISLESFMMAVAEKMGLPGYGADGFGPSDPFRRPEDFYLRMVADLAWGEKRDGSDAVPEAGDEELGIFEKARRHLPKTVFDLAKWQAAVGPHWKRAVTVLNRGGRFQDHEKAFDGEKVKNKYGKQIDMYAEKVAKTKSSMTGKSNWGMAAYFPIADCMGNPLSHKEGDLHLITHREIFHTKSRTGTNPWLLELMPENTILINSRDAARLGLKDGDKVRLVSDSNPEGVWDLPNFGKKPMVAKLGVTEGIRPGVVTFSLGHGHWAYGASDVTIDGQVVRGDPRRGAGIHGNAAMMVDPHLKNVCLQDLVGGSAVFYDSPVRLVPEKG